MVFVCFLKPESSFGVGVGNEWQTVEKWVPLDGELIKRVDIEIQRIEADQL